MYEVARRAFYPIHGIDTNTSVQILKAKIMFCLIMSKLILVQNNHFSKVCTVFCLIKKKHLFNKYRPTVIKIFLISKDSESIEGDPIIIENIFTVVTTNYILLYDMINIMFLNMMVSF